MIGPRRKGTPASTLSRRSRATLRLGFRLAARNAWRARSRSLLIILLVAIPVLGLTTASTVALSEVGTVAQNAQSGLGHMAASLTSEGGRVTQDALGRDVNQWGSSSPTSPSTWVPSRWQLVPLQPGELFLHSAHGVAGIDGEVGKSWDRAFAGRFELLTGRSPVSGSELLVSPTALKRLGARVGGTVHAAGDDRAYTIVGTMRDLTEPANADTVFGSFAAFPGAKASPEDQTVYYLAGPPVTASDIHAFNRHGGVVLSRETTQSIDIPELNTGWALVAVFAIVAAFMLVEIALLSGAAFMVGARQQQRALAVLASVGADRRVLRASVASGGLVLGAAGTILGVGLGLLAAWMFMRLTANGSITQYYGFDAFPPALAILGAVAVLAAWISAAVPARSISRFDIVAALRGARRPAKPSRLRSAVGVVLIVIGAGIAVLGGLLILVASNQNPPSPWLQGGGPTLLVVGSIALQIGAILALPALLGAVGRWMARIGSSARLASRDVARNSARSVPAIAVVMSTAFVAVFLMATLSGAEALQTSRYPWSAPPNSTLIQFQVDQRSGVKPPLPVNAAVADAYAREANTVLGVSTARVIDGAPDPLWGATPKAAGYIAPTPEIYLNRRGACEFQEGSRNCVEPQFLATDGTGAKLLVGDVADLTTLLGQRPSPAAIQALDNGGAVSLYPQYVANRKVTIDWWTQKQISVGDDSIPGKRPSRSVQLRATVDSPAHPGAFGIMMSPATARTIGMTAGPRFVLATKSTPPTTAQQDALTDYIDEHSGPGRQPQADLNVELGPAHTSESADWIIVAITALSTLASAVIALSLARIDGRRDEYTLISVGAKPRTIRLVAFWQALVLAGLGSIIGALFALVPTAALAYANSIQFAPPWTALATSVLGVPVAIAVIALIIRRPARTALPDRSLIG